MVNTAGTTTRGQKAAATRRANKVAAARAGQVRVAVADEHFRFNRALANGAVAVLDTFCGAYRVTSAEGFDITSLETFCAPYRVRTWMIGNDARWADLLRQAGVARHPLFAVYA